MVIGLPLAANRRRTPKGSPVTNASSWRLDKFGAASNAPRLCAFNWQRTVMLRMNTGPTPYVTSTGGTALLVFDRAASYTLGLMPVSEYGEKSRGLRQGKGQAARWRANAFN